MHFATFARKLVKATTQFLVCANSARNGNFLYSRLLDCKLKRVDKLLNCTFLKTGGNIRTGYFLSLLFKVMYEVYNESFESAIAKIQVI